MSYSGIDMSLNKSKEELNEAVNRLRRAELKDLNRYMDEIERAAHCLVEEGTKALSIYRLVNGTIGDLRDADYKINTLINIIGEKQ